MKWLFVVATVWAICPVPVLAQDSATLEANKALARQAQQMWSTGDIATAGDIYASAYVNHEPADDGKTRPVDLKTYLAAIADFHRSFNPIDVTVLSQTAEADMVATRWQLSAIHTGDFMGLAATGKEIVYSGIRIDRIENGRIAESWGNWNKYGLLSQLGLVN